MSAKFARIRNSVAYTSFSCLLRAAVVPTVVLEVTSSGRMHSILTSHKKVYR